ncbi:MAG: DNA-formamidopyrimidine glycosylase, partial [Solirubrobacteraceae bacterium]|nr:DNA-formamidopyrimidine glycosylase [Solirubrobacteraceae bacterium]
MPELPEVETVRRQLAPHLQGRTITAVRIDDARWCAPQEAGVVEQQLTGRRIEALERRGKHLIVRLDDDQHLLMHLRMTGIILWEPAPDAPYERVRIWLDDEHAIAFCDPRRFGTGLLLPDAETTQAYLDERLGPEPLDPEAFTDAVLRAVLRDRDAPVKGLLLDQKRIAGIGNIYADEALFRAGIHPARPGRQVKPAQIGPLREGIVEALQLGIDSGGASIDDFRHL